MVRSECGPHLLLHHGRIVAVKLWRTAPWQRKPRDLERVGAPAPAPNLRSARRHQQSNPRLIFTGANAWRRRGGGRDVVRAPRDTR
jgi:hypothetical protein